MVIFVGVAAFGIGIVGGYYLRGYLEGDVIGSLRDALSSAYDEIEALEDKITEKVLKAKPKKAKTTPTT